MENPKKWIMLIKKSNYTKNVSNMIIIASRKNTNQQTLGYITVTHGKHTTIIDHKTVVFSEKVQKGGYTTNTTTLTNTIHDGKMFAQTVSEIRFFSMSTAFHRSILTKTTTTTGVGNNLGNTRYDRANATTTGNSIHTVALD